MRCTIVVSLVKIGLLSFALLAGAATNAFANGTISGTMTGSGSPLAGVVMQFYNLISDDDFPYETTTDASGNYTMSNLPPGTYAVLTQDITGSSTRSGTTFRARRRATRTRSTRQLHRHHDQRGDRDQFRPRPGARIAGTITDGVNPIAGIKVYFIAQIGRFSVHQSGDQRDGPVPQRCRDGDRIRVRPHDEHPRLPERVRTTTSPAWTAT